MTEYPTLTDALAAVGIDARTAEEIGHRHLPWSRPTIIRPAFSTASERDHAGRVYVHCGGECILAFDPLPAARNRGARPVYLVHDDTAARAWDAARIRDHAGDGLATVAERGPRPSPAVRLVLAG